jgi:putative ABC transport system ATP-binding protein
MLQTRTRFSGASALHLRSIPLHATGIRHAYQQGLPPAVVLDDFVVPPGTTVALTGPSGSGKTTLAYLLSGIELVREGSVRWGTTDLATLPEAARDAWRRQHAGFVFQDFHLIPGLSILGNVLVTCWFDHWRADPVMTERAGELLDRFGVPSSGWQVQKLSRGEQQRVAISRALLRSPAILIADEPTASLDAKSGGAVIEILLDQARQTAATLLVVTHDPELIAAVDTT